MDFTAAVSMAAVVGLAAVAAGMAVAAVGPAAAIGMVDIGEAGVGTAADMDGARLRSARLPVRPPSAPRPTARAIASRPSGTAINMSRNG